MNRLSLHQAAHASHLAYDIESCFGMFTIPGHALCVGRDHSYTIMHLGALRSYMAKQQFLRPYWREVIGCVCKQLEEKLSKVVE